jgi:hypothetical protein
VLARQPDATDAFAAAVAAAFGVLDTSSSDEREWRVVGQVDWPLDAVRIEITPTGRTCPVPGRPVVLSANTKGTV